MRSPPLSPSTQTVTSFFLQSSTIVGGTDVPLIAIAFFIPCFRRLSTSALPSTMIISSLSSIAGPAGSLSFPYSCISITLTEYATSSASSCESGIVVSISCFRSSFALSTTKVLLEILISSMFFTFIFALHGPILWMISIAAATIAVSALSREDGMIISPLVLPDLVSVLTSILPILPDLWSSLSSSSVPRRPSVCPKIAPITSGLSTTPSISISACTIYFAATGLIFPILFASEININYDFLSLKKKLI